MPSLWLAALPDTVPSSWYDPLLLPVLLTIVGAIVYLFGRNAEFKMQSKWKWWALAPFLLGLWTGFGPASYLSDPVYRAAVDEYGKKMLFAHYGAFIVPFVGVLVAVGWHLLDRKLEARS